MSAHTPDHVVYMPATMSHSTTTVKRLTGTSRSSGLGEVFARMLGFLVSIPRRQAVKTELSRLSDRELADIGLSRSEISQVFSRTR